MKSELIKELAGLGFYTEEHLRQHATLIDSVTRRTFSPGEVIYHGGDASDVLFVIRTGMLKLLAYLPNGRSRIVRLHKSGSILGLDGLLNKPHDYTAIAIGEVSAYVIPHSELSAWRERSPEMYSQLLERWHEYLIYADTWITDFSVGSVKGRVARLLRFLAHFETETGPQVIELLTTEEMADILGVTPESVSRVVAEFKRQKILQEIENNDEPLYSCDTTRLEDEARQ